MAKFASDNKEASRVRKKPVGCGWMEGPETG
jgi:hypothetical protein